jgi:HAD superfamily hydrolase (TIGR01450 family)
MELIAQREPSIPEEFRSGLRLSTIRAFFFDLDGVLSVGKENPRYLGGREVTLKIRSSGRKVFLLTNDSTHTRDEIVQNLAKMGFNFSKDEILTSSYLTSLYLLRKYGKCKFFLVGERGLLQELELAGHRNVENDPDVVVVGFDRGLTYAKLDRALSALRNRAKLIGSYGGAVFMSDHGPALSAGPIIKALEYGAGERAIMIGKPSPRMFHLALGVADVKASEAVMVGDQIETDMIGASRAGVHTILVLTGVETRETVAKSKLKPEMVLENVDSLLRLL